MKYCNKILLLLSGIWLTSLMGCGYKQIADTEFLPQSVYIAAAVSGTIYTIDAIPVHSSNTPTEGTVFRFVVDSDNNVFDIPMAVLRSGPDNNGSVNVAISPNNDTISKLVAAGRLAATVLPAANYTLPSSVTIADGATRGNFNIPVDFRYLMDNSPGNRYALAFDISSEDRAVNRALGTLVVVVDTRIMSPVVDLSAKADLNQWNRVLFTNNSSYITSSEWDFGDGSTSTEMNPSHVYDEAGMYDVTLTATGISGEESSKTIGVTVIESHELDKSLWSIHSFNTEEASGEGPVNGHATAAIDGDTATFWHSQWQGGTPPQPHWIAVDMGKPYILVSVAAARRRDDNRGQTRCKIYTSLDGETWTDRGEFTVNPDTNDPQTFSMPTLEPARYFKYEAIESRQGFSFLGELWAYGAEE